MARRWVGVTMLASILASAGCLGGGPDADGQEGSLPQGSLVQTQSEAPPEAELSEGFGALAGSVLTDAGAPIPMPHVFLLGTNHSTVGDKQGRFALSNVAPGTYVLRAEAQFYKSLEQSVAVAAGNITQVFVTLVPLDDRALGYRDHLHDFWGDQQRLELYNGLVEWPTSLASGGAAGGTPCMHVRGAVTVSGACTGIDFHLGNGTLVPPGTAALEILVDWKDNDWVKEVAFNWQAANGTSLSPLMVKPGEMALLTVAPVMADHGHARFTAWRFNLGIKFTLVDQSPVLVWINQGDLIRREVGPFTVTIVAVKGEVPPEPPHPLFWSGGPALVLLESEEHKVSGLVRLVKDPKATACAATSACFTLPKGVLVPPGTTRLDVTLEYSMSLPALEAVATQKTLTFRTAAVDANYATMQDLRVEDPSERSGHVVKWALKLDPREQDPFYQKRSGWAFFVANEGREREVDYYNECYYACTNNFKLHVEAVNENWTPDLASGKSES